MMSRFVFSAICSIWSQNSNRTALSEGDLREARSERAYRGLTSPLKTWNPIDMTSNSQPSSHDRRKFFASTLIGLASGLPSVAMAAETVKPVAAKINPLNPPDAPAADAGYTPGIVAEGQ